MSVTKIEQPLDALATAGLLSDDPARNAEMLAAGVRFATLHHQLFGGPAAADATIDRDAADRYRQSRAALLAASRRVLDAVTNACVYRRPLSDKRTRPALHQTELLALRRGLGILADLLPA